ncbi:hypothetical protein M514_10345, partial [Trichuris suis]
MVCFTPPQSDPMVKPCLCSLKVTSCDRSVGKCGLSKMGRTSRVETQVCAKCCFLLLPWAKGTVIHSEMIHYGGGLLNAWPSLKWHQHSMPLHALIGAVHSDISPMV